MDPNGRNRSDNLVNPSLTSTAIVQTRNESVLDDRTQVRAMAMQHTSFPTPHGRFPGSLHRPTGSWNSGFVLDEKVKKKLLAIKKSGCSGDPFGSQYQEVIDNLWKLASTMNERSDFSFSQLHFPLAIMLMDCSTRIYKQRVDLTKRDVNRLAAKIIARNEQSKSTSCQAGSTQDGVKAKGDKLAKALPVREDAETDHNTSHDSGIELSDSVDQLQPPIEDNTVPEKNGEGPELPNLIVEATSTSPADLTSNDVDVAKTSSTECITISDDEEDMELAPTNSVQQEIELAPASLVQEEMELVPTDSVQEEMEVESVQPEINQPESSTTIIISEAPAPVLTNMTNSESYSDNTTANTEINEAIALDIPIVIPASEDAVEDTSPIPRKRLKIEYGLPPTLTAWYEDEPAFEFDEPPELSREMYKRKKPGIEINTDEKQDRPKGSRKSASIMEASTSVSEPEVTGAKESESTLQSATSTTPELVGNNDSTNSCLPVLPQQPVIPPIQEQETSLSSVLPEAASEVLIKVEEDSLFPEAGDLDSFQEFFSNSSSGNSFTPEDEVQLLAFIKQLHYLSFTCELTNEELQNTYRKAMQRLENIYREHNVAVSRNIPQNLEATSGDISIKLDPCDDNNCVPDSDEVTELFSERIKRRLLNQEYSGQTIMESTKEKNKGDSDLKMRKMVQEKQKNIVPKYSNIPLIAENTKGFFQRVRSFENRMMKVLATEQSKEEFDIEKYESEVLDHTHAEIELQSQNDEEVQSLSMSNDVSIGSKTPETPDSEGILDMSETASSEPLQCTYPFNFDGLPSPSSSCSGSSSGQGMRWISLQKIFSHMKTLQPQEAARMFYAVLALLSFENLDIKSDSLSASDGISAPVLDLEGRSSRGFKIISSKGVDMDTEDVYVAILSSKLRTESFREGLDVEEEFKTPEMSPSKYNTIPPALLSPPSSEHSNSRESSEQLHKELRVQISPHLSTVQNNIAHVSGSHTQSLMHNLLKTVRIRRRNAASHAVPFSKDKEFQRPCIRIRTSRGFIHPS